MYKYLIICLRNYGYRHLKKKIRDNQENLYYKIFKLLTITRNYSSRIWNEIKLQLLKTLRVYNRTTGKKNIDELKESITDHLKEVLPKYMLPSRIKFQTAKVSHRFKKL